MFLKGKKDIIRLDEHNYIIVKIMGNAYETKILDYVATSDNWEELYELLQEYRASVATPILSVNIMKMDIEDRIKFRVHGFGKYLKFKPWEWRWIF